MASVPIEYLVVAFPDGNMSDEMAPELADLVDKKVIRILDIVSEIDGEVGGLIGPDDLEFVASELDPGSAAAVLLVEDLWAAPLAAALDRSGGVLLEGARIPEDLLYAEIARLAGGVLTGHRVSEPETPVTLRP